MGEKNSNLFNELMEYPIGRRVRIIYGDHVGKTGIIVNKRFYKKEDGQKSCFVTIKIDNLSTNEIEEIQTDIFNIV